VKIDKGLYWSRNFISHQLGRGDKLTRNNIVKSVAKELSQKQSNLRDLFLEEYSELADLVNGFITNNENDSKIIKPLATPYQGERKGQGKDKDKNKEMESIPITKINLPSIEEFTNYLLTELPKINNVWQNHQIKRAASLQFETYTESDSNPNVWRDGNGKKITNWKTKIKNTAKHWKPWNYGVDNTQNNTPQTFAEMNAKAKSDQLSKNLQNPLF